jgi:glycosyltransferase involved in cell wall biosynthesis
MVAHRPCRTKLTEGGRLASGMAGDGLTIGRLGTRMGGNDHRSSTSLSEDYPRVLIFGGGFDTYSGTGITLSNLFGGWPIERLAVADSVARSDTADFACAEYRLGTLEHRWIWPLSHVPRQSESSGTVDSTSGAMAPAPVGDRVQRRAVSSARAAGGRVARLAFRGVIDRLGAEEALQRSVLSGPLSKWVDQFSPDVLYCHFSALQSMRLVRALHQHTGARLAIHMMDDWPETVYGGTLFGPALRASVDRELHELFAHADVRMAISKGMADEYRMRYGCEFEVFHNCIDVKWWRETRKRSWDVSSPLGIVYSGRVGWDALASFHDVCAAVELMNGAGLATEFRIYSRELGRPGPDALAKYPHTMVLPAVEQEQLRGVLCGADVLIIPSDFEGRGPRFVRLSMPTKVPAYMASGTPVVLYSPGSHALCAWARETGWGLVVGERSPRSLALALRGLASDPRLGEALGRTASRIADSEFDGLKVRNAFRDSLAGRVRQGEGGLHRGPA